MHARDILPWNWGKRNVPVRRGAGSKEASQPGLSSFFDEFFGGDARWPQLPRLMRDFPGGLLETDRFLPALDATETDREIRVAVELPGLEEKDIDVSLEGDTLTIRGEKLESSERDDKAGHWVERRFGSFQRVVPLPYEIDADKVEASFKNGVLEVVLPKSTASQPPKRGITVKKA